MRRRIVAPLMVAWLASVPMIGQARQLNPSELLGEDNVLTTCGEGRLPSAIGCIAKTDPTAPNEVVPGTDSPLALSPVSAVDYVKVTVPKPWGGSDGAPCVKIIEIWVPEGTVIPENGGVPERFSVCPPNLLGDPPRPAGEASGDSTSANTPAILASSYWNEIPLPEPEPYIAPGRAITGMYAYLETRGTTTHSFTETSTPFGPLEIVATGHYYVDWGDGTHTGPHASEGGPWPDGRITHEYINIGTYDVVVTERWTATWSFGAESGTLDELQTVGRIEDFPVEQIQAVVLR